MGFLLKIHNNIINKLISSILILMRYIKNGVYLASAASLSTFGFLQHPSLMQHRLFKSQTVSRCQDGDDSISSVLRTEFKDYTQVQKERISVKDRMKYDFELKTRKQHLNDLKTKVYDILIIWGDANGAEVLLDAASQFL